MIGGTRVAVHAGVATFAAATALAAVFAGWSWLLPVAGGIAVVVIANELVRIAPIPTGFGPLVAAAGIFCFVTTLYARDEARWGIIPTGASLRALSDVARSGFDDIRTLATPVPAHDGLVLLTVVGIAAVALVVHLIAVTLRRAALAGLPLLAIFALCTSVAKHGAGWIPFVLATAAYLWLLLADSRERLARWGRPVGFDRESRPTFSWSDQDVMPSPLSVMGRRIGFAAIAIGVVLPLLIPGMRGGVPHDGHGGLGFGGGSGSSTAIAVNPIVTISANLKSGDDRVVLQFTSSDPDPGYLRLTALDQFNGDAFTPSSLSAPANAVVGDGIPVTVPDGPQQTTEVQVQGLSTRWLPLPQQVTSVQIPGDWHYDAGSNSVFSAREDSAGVVYDATSVKPPLTSAALALATSNSPEAQPFTQHPELSPAVVRLTHDVVDKALATTPFAKAAAIQRFLTSAPFIYDVTVPASGSADALADFLLVSHRGFCQQYASAMAVMARILGIPSRVAVGFTHGDRQQDGSWVVTSHDAHAWPELWFDQYGWVAFEPTPRLDGQAETPEYTLVPTSPSGNNKGPDTPKGQQQGGKGKGQNAPGVSKNGRLDDSFDNVTGGNPTSDVGPAKSPSSLRAVALWTAGVLVLLLLIVPSIARVVTRRRRWARATTLAERAGAAWEELRATAMDARAGWVDGLTPRATARVLRAEAGGLATAEVRALDRIVDAVQRAWYSPDGRPRTDTLEEDVADIRTALLSEATMRERLVLRLWPRSTVAAAIGLVGRAGALLDAFDLAAARLRARFRRPAPSTP